MRIRLSEIQYCRLRPRLGLEFGGATTPQTVAVSPA
jgi:hypothetical protein